MNCNDCSELIEHCRCGVFGGRRAAAPSLAPDAPRADAITAKPLKWEQHGTEWSDDRGFYITFDAEEEEPYGAAWGEGDTERFATLEAAQVWCHDELTAWLRSCAVVAAPAAQAGQWVPREPSEAMLKACDTIIQGYGAKLVWARMLAAAPPQAAPEPAGLLSRLRECLPRVGERENVWCSVNAADLREAVALLERADLAQPDITQLRTALDAILNHPPGSAHRIARQALDAQPVATEATPETKGARDTF